MPHHAFRTLDELDASIFSGDAMESDEFRKQLRWYVGRWTRALDQCADPTCPHGDDWDDCPVCRH